MALLSGGLDSTVATALAHAEVGVAFAITLDYGQRSAAREVDRSARFAAALGIPQRVVALPLWEAGGGGALLGQAEVPTLEPAELEARAGDDRLERTAQAVWVPNRNGVFVQVAAALAEAAGLDRVVVGFNREEAATFPDNGPAFVEATDRALSLSTRTGVRLLAPTVHLDKRQIVDRAIELELDLRSLWSCYLGAELHCGRCESCRRLRRALEGKAVRPPPFASGS